MDPALITTTVIGLALAAASLLSQTALWQRKEYRFDRFWAYLTSSEFSLHEHRLDIAAAIATVLGWLIFLSGNIVAADLFGWVALGCLALHHGRRIASRGVLRPDFTVKAITLLGTTGLLALLYVILTISPFMMLALQWATLVVLIPELTALAVPIINVPFGLKKQQVIKQAHAVRTEHRKLDVVGITGSYGKTSTKLFLNQILTHAGIKHAASRDHRNDIYPIALDMLEQLEPGLRVYVAEMGAYRAGEISRLAALTEPSIGVITAISNQHVALFGSLTKLAAAKWELIKSLPDDGTAVINADDETILAQAARDGLPRHVIRYSLKDRADVFATNTRVQTRHIKTTLHIGDYEKEVRLPLVGDALLGSVVAASAIAHALKVAPSTIFTSLSHLTPPPQTMELRAGLKGSTVIDDSYSANEAGVVAALRHLARFPEKKKIVVITPLIELGSEAASAHIRIGQALRDIGAAVFLAGTAHERDLRRGAGSDVSLLAYADPAELARAVAQQLDRDTVILLEGRIPSVVRNTVLI